VLPEVGRPAVGRTVGVLEVDMGLLAILRRTDGEGMAAAAAIMVAQGLLRGVMVVMVLQMDMVAVHIAVVGTAVVAQTMELREVGGVAGDVLIYVVAFNALTSYTSCYHWLGT